MAVITCTTCGEQNGDGDQFCRRCGSFLEWTGQREEAGDGNPGAVQPRQQTRWTRPSAEPIRAGPPILAALRQAAVAVTPGATATFAVEIRNAGRTVDQVSVEVFGDAVGWARVVPSTLNLFPDGREQVLVQVTPPRSSDARAGAMEVGIAIRSSEHASDSVVLHGSLEIAPFAEFELELAPKIIRAGHRGTYRLRATNTGNGPITFSLAGSDPEAALGFTGTEVPLEVPAGGTAIRVVRASAPGWKLFGQPRTLPFQVAVVPAGGQKRTLDGILVQTARLPGWLPLAVGAGAAAIAAVVVLRPFGPGPVNPTPAPSIQAVRDDTTQTSGPDAPPPTPAPVVTAPPTEAPPTEPTVTEAPPTPEVTAPPTEPPAPAAWWEDAAREAEMAGFPLGAPYGEGGTTLEGMRYIEFESGAVIERADGGVYWMPAAIVEKWRTLGGSAEAASELGLPITSLLSARDGIHRRQVFDTGVVFWDSNTTYAVYGFVWDALLRTLNGIDSYKALNLGIPDYTGYPTGDSQLYPGGQGMLEFETGRFWVDGGVSTTCTLRDVPDNTSVPYCYAIPLPGFVTLPPQQ